MKRIVLVFGVISGLISSALMFLTMLFVDRGIVNFSNGEVVGYTAIFLSFVVVFFGIRTYRENHGGTITFGRAFTVGILITLISCVFYVVSGEIIYYKMTPDFMDKYAAAEVDSLRAKGASDAQIVAKRKEMQDLKVMLDNPLMYAAMAFVEPFPVGLLVTAVSAAILRRRSSAPNGATTASALTAIF